MKILKNLNKILLSFAVVLILLFGVFTIVPVSFGANAEQAVEDFEAFNASLMEMLDKFDNQPEEIVETSTTFSQESSSVDFSYQENAAQESRNLSRLIVKSAGVSSSCGAVATAEYKDWHIFQYQDAQDASFAYDYFSSLDVAVSYDDVVMAQDVTVESVYNSNPWADGKNFKSWGAEVVGYKSYADTMFKQSEGNLSDVIVAVLDSGINTSHELFVKGERILSKYARDFTREENHKSEFAYEDLNGHGSHTSGIIAETTLDNVKILPLKVLNSNGKGSVSMIVAALEYLQTLRATNKNIKVMNMSIGVEIKNGESVRNTSLEEAIVDVYNCGIVPVVSAGNDCLDTSLACPANVPEAVTVTALKNENGSLQFDASYSNFGVSVDFSAPGTSIVSAGMFSPTSYVTLSGTSMAAPHVASCAALLYSNPVYTAYSVDEICRLLKENAIDCGDEGWDALYGHGCVCIAGVGITFKGYVNFSNTEEFHENEFFLSLSYSEGDNVKIYYTFNEYATNVDETNGIEYTSPIKMSQTAKITAAAYLDSGTNGIMQSYVCSQTYYFNNVDLLSNYDFEFSQSNFGYVLKKYKGKLTTLTVPSKFQNLRIFSIGANAFNASKVQVLNLPNTIYKIDASAFENNTNLREINCDGAGSTQIGAYAFYKCTNLEKFNVSKVSSIGNYSFSYCKNLKTLELFSVGNIGKHALSGSGVEELFVGGSILMIADHTMLNLRKVYGYAQTQAEQFAFKHNIEFVDLSLRFTKDLGKRLIVREGEEFSVSLAYFGREVTYEVVSTTKSIIGNQQTDGFETTLQLHFDGLQAGTYQLYVKIYDEAHRFSPIRSNVLKIDVVEDDAETFMVDFNVKQHFNVLVDGFAIGAMELLFKDVEYTILIEPEVGYVLKSVVINGKAVQEFSPVGYEFVNEKGSAGLKIEVEAVPKNLLSVVFETDGKGEILMDDDTVVSTEILRENDLSFTIKPKDGLRVLRVMANNTLLTANDGVYTIKNILSDVIVRVVFVEQFNNVYVTCGKGGSISTTGEIAQSDLAYGKTREYTITPSEGYDIDFVSVNGQRVAFHDNRFQIVNDATSAEQQISVVISFKKAKGFLFENSAVFTYFIVILVVFVGFIFAKVLLFLIRKKNKKD